jgi:hypothetical protein
MRKRIAILFLVLSCSVCWAQGRNFFDSVSPKLNKFLIDNPAACKVLTNALVNAFATNSLTLYYFYSDDESQARAYHYYPNTAGSASVYIFVRENQTALDEFIALFFETLNTKGQDRFVKLFEKAKAGTISKSEFAKEILKVEFEAMKKAQAVFTSLKFSKKETNKSDLYRVVVECPTEYEEFELHCTKDSPHRDPIKEYESKYDLLRKVSEDSTPQTNSIAPKN